jgi:hypothetical protein
MPVIACCLFRQYKEQDGMAFKRNQDYVLGKILRDRRVLRTRGGCSVMEQDPAGGTDAA